MQTLYWELTNERTSAISIDMIVQGMVVSIVMCLAFGGKGA